MKDKVSARRTQSEVASKRKIFENKQSRITERQMIEQKSSFVYARTERPGKSKEAQLTEKTSSVVCSRIELPRKQKERQITKEMSAVVCSKDKLHGIVKGQRLTGQESVHSCTRPERPETLKEHRSIQQNSPVVCKQADESGKLQEKQSVNKKSPFVYRQLDRQFAPKKEEKGEERKEHKMLTCYDKMDNALKKLKSEMVQLACLNVKLMEKMIEMQNQIESIKQDRVNRTLEEYKERLFDEKIEQLSARISNTDGRDSRSNSLFDENNNEDINPDCVFSNENLSIASDQSIKFRRKFTLDSLTSLPSMSSVPSEGSFTTTETDNEEDFVTNETCSADSGIDLHYELPEIDSFMAATTSTL